MQTAVSVERQITKNANIAISYLNSKGVHQFLTRNINAPLPGTYDPIGSDERNPAVRECRGKHVPVRVGRRV